MIFFVFLFLGVESFEISKDDYPTYNMCKLFPSDQLTHILPDMGLLDQVHRV